MDDSQLTETRASGFWRDVPFPVADVMQRLRDSDQFSESQLDLIHVELKASLAVVQSENISYDISMGMTLANYQVERLIGTGGAGHVYLARTESGDPVALKVLRKSRLSPRFRREMEIVERLAHPNIVVAYDTGHEDRFAFIAMEHLRGPDLQHHVKRDGPIDWKQSIDIIRQAALGLEHAHDRGLVHRDVKPGNLLWDDNDVIKVADLGLASSTTLLGDADSDGSFQTRDSVVAGTPEFMSPEQAKAFSDATVQSDIYSLGATWFYLLTGRARVPGSTFVEKLSSLVKGTDLEEMPEGLMPSKLTKIWRMMVEYDVEARWQTMRQLISAIDEAHVTSQTTSPKETIDVLIVEDNQDDLYLTIEMLSRLNRSIVIKKASTMKRATEICKANDPFDVILLDLQLSDSFGIATVVNMKEHAGDAPIVVLTGNDDAKAGQACIEAGAEEYVYKNALNAQQLERLLFIAQSRASHRE
ncbi:protein kinase domain-containing protein [Planctomycetes bacterium K23_9]|uniref:protein kinase domain-containing protein n=1 Tax=Stieleria marina TaxID=1930275 RepID=UPI0011A86A0F